MSKNAAEQDKKKKQKYKKIEVQDIGKGQILLPGRISCDCMTMKHKLVNNCLVCGKIVCEQEGEGPCFFCGNPVYSVNNPLANEGFITLEDSNVRVDSSKLKALEHKNKLLAYDKNQVQGSNIIDDETDWYEISDNVWLSEKQRDFAISKIKEEEGKLEESQRGISITYDPTLGKIVAGKSEYDQSKGIEEAKAFLDDITKSKNKLSGAKKSNQLSADQEKVHTELSEQIREKYKAQASKFAHRPDDADQQGSFQPRSKRVQHDDVFEEFKAAVEKHANPVVENSADYFDEEIFPLETQNGSCLSMHQPWASLVVWGFKRFEGRMWTSRYRGPLWIQAGSKVPTDEEIKAVEDQYKRLYRNVKDLPPFPERYPTGCLLGIVDLEDIVRVEDYFRYIPEEKREETGCRYLFVVRNPRKLLYPIKLPGEREIFKVDNLDLLEKAQRSLMKVRTNWYPYYANLLRGKERTPDEDLELDSMKLDYRKDDIGQLVGLFFANHELVHLAETIVNVLKGEGTKYIGKNYMKTVSLTDSDPVCQKMKKFLPLIAQKRLRKDRQEFEEKMNLMDFFMVGDKDKDIKVDSKYSLMLVLGRPVKFSSELYKKKTLILNNGWLAFINQEGDVNLTIENIEKYEKESEEAKAVTKVTENNAIILFIY